VVQSAISLAHRGPTAPAAPAPVAEVCDDLLELFRSVTDGRSGRGRDHPVAAVLALAAAAVVAGMKGYTAIAGWVRDVPPPVRADLYLRAGAAPAQPPSKATVWRVITDADAEVFDAAVGRWLMSGQAIGDGEGAGGDDPPGLVPVRPGRQDGPGREGRRGSPAASAGGAGRARRAVHGRRRAGRGRGQDQ
jgi:DDE family transposase